jgi:hypothetical protein
MRNLAFHLTAEAAKSISLSANAERLRYAGLFEPFHGCYLPRYLFVG